MALLRFGAPAKRRLIHKRFVCKADYRDLQRRRCRFRTLPCTSGFQKRSPNPLGLGLVRLACRMVDLIRFMGGHSEKDELFSGLTEGKLRAAASFHKSKTGSDVHLI